MSSMCEPMLYFHHRAPHIKPKLLNIRQIFTHFTPKSHSVILIMCKTHDKNKNKNKEKKIPFFQD